MTSSINKNSRAALCFGILLAMIAPAVSAQSPAQVEKAVKEAFTRFETLQEGKNADYIPALATVDPNLFGIVVVTADGRVYTAGNITKEVSIQSISKVFTMARVIQDQGPDAIKDNMGVDATGQVFNSIVAIEQAKGDRKSVV